jgi:hypothetical protein
MSRNTENKMLVLRSAFTPIRLIIVPWLIPRWARAQVWGRVILIRRGAAVTEQLLAHELAHVLQWRLMGILPFMFYYLKYFVRHGYQNHPLERQARAAEEQDFYRAWARRMLSSSSGS